jgi:hypothetical protein
MFSFSSSIINYFKFDDGFILQPDVISNTSVSYYSNMSFFNDRFNRTKSAALFASGYAQLSAAKYFYGGDFTISVWARFDSLSLINPSIIDFGNGPNKDNIFMCLTQSENIFCDVTKGATRLNNCNSVSRLSRNVWYHLVCVLRGSVLSIYINGDLDVQCPHLIPNGVVRTFNYIGKSNWNGESLLVGAIDELQIYNNSLTDEQIKILYNTGY